MIRQQAGSVLLNKFSRPRFTLFVRTLSPSVNSETVSTPPSLLTSPVRYISITNIDCRYINTLEKNDIDMVSFENIDIDKAILKNIDIDKAILKYRYR